MFHPNSLKKGRAIVSRRAARGPVNADKPGPVLAQSVRHHAARVRGSQLTEREPMEPSSRTPSGTLLLIRHGRTDWANNGWHTGRMDIPLDRVGEQQARRLGTFLDGSRFTAIVTSPLSRAADTAALAGLEATAVDPDLMEWDYGGYEGMTTPAIREKAGADWLLFHDGVIPGTEEWQGQGETLEQVATRCRRVIERITPALHQGDVALVAHGHLLRVLTTVWLDMPPMVGSQLQLDPASLSKLGHRHGKRTIEFWNVTPDLTAPR